MENLNTRKYLENIRFVVFCFCLCLCSERLICFCFFLNSKTTRENLRHMNHAPSVSHVDLPEGRWSSDEEEDEDEREGWRERRISRMLLFFSFLFSFLSIH